VQIGLAHELGNRSRRAVVCDESTAKYNMETLPETLWPQVRMGWPKLRP
jgi:hypothetical protein